MNPPSTRTRTALALALLTTGLLGASAGSDTQQRSVRHNVPLHHASVTLTEVGGCSYVVAIPPNYGGIAVIHHAACQNPAHSGVARKGNQ